MQDIKSITLCSDNLSEITFAPEDIDLLTIKGLSSDIIKFSDGIKVIDTCDKVIMRVKHEANQIIGAPYGEFGTIFNLLHQDHCVVSIDVKYEDGDDECETTIYVPNDGDMTNLCMSTKLTDDGDLLLVISRDDDVGTIFGGNCFAHCCCE